MKGDRSTDASKVNPPLTEDQILAVAVVQPQVLNGPIHLAQYDPAWPSLYDQLENNIREALGDKLLLIEHVGSTSVPGLSAKPIIDMVLAVADSTHESFYVQPLEEKGYILRVREPDWYEHRLLKPPDIDGNLHVFSTGCEEIEQMLLFRDWLRSHPEDRLLYEKTKRQLAAQTWKYTQNYADAKSEVVQEILSRARLHQTS